MRGQSIGLLELVGPEVGTAGAWPPVAKGDQQRIWATS
jgi:hypothetical protein